MRVERLDILLARVVVGNDHVPPARIAPSEALPVRKENAILGQRGPVQGLVSGSPVCHRDELNGVPHLDPESGSARGPNITIVGMRPECDDAHLAAGLREEDCCRGTDEEQATGKSKCEHVRWSL